MSRFKVIKTYPKVSVRAPLAGGKTDYSWEEFSRKRNALQYISSLGRQTGVYALGRAPQEMNAQERNIAYEPQTRTGLAPEILRIWSSLPPESSSVSESHGDFWRKLTAMIGDARGHPLSDEEAEERMRKGGDSTLSERTIDHIVGNVTK